MRIALAIAVVATLGGLTVLRSEARIAESMAPVGCESGSALDLQRGPMASGDSGVRDVVSGWHLFTRLSTPAQIDPRTTLACEWPAGTAVPTAEARYSGLRAAKAWLWTDTLAFVPAYVAATVLVLVALRRRILAPRSDFAPFLRLIGWVLERRIVFYGLVACIATAAVADQVENHVLRTRLDSWWNVLDRGPLEVSLDLTAAHVAGWIKWVLLLPPMLVVLVAAIASLFAGAVSLGRVLRDAWFQVALVVAFVAAVLLPPQSADALRRLSSGDWALTTLLVATLAAVIARQRVRRARCQTRPTIRPARGDGRRFPRSASDWRSVPLRGSRSTTGGVACVCRERSSWPSVSCRSSSISAAVVRRRAPSGPRNGVGTAPSASASSRHRHLVEVPEAIPRAQPSPTRATASPAGSVLRCHWRSGSEHCGRAPVT